MVDRLVSVNENHDLPAPVKARLLEEVQDGASAYDLAVANGYTGTLTEWLASLKGGKGDPGLEGDPGPEGPTAYEVAVSDGFAGTKSEWLASLEGTDGVSAYQVAVANGYAGTEAEWLASLEGPQGEPGTASDADISAVVEDPNSQTRGALSATYATNEYVQTTAFGTNLEATDATVETWVGNTSTLTGEALDAEFATKQEGLLHAARHGVTGDGVTDDTTAINDALSAGATFGIPVRLPRNATIGVTATVTIPPGCTLHTNGASFVDIVDMARVNTISANSNCTIIGGLRVTTKGGAEDQGVTISTASNVSIDHVVVNSEVAGAGSGNDRDNGLRIVDSDHIRIGVVQVRNFDHALYAERVPNLSIDYAVVETYVTGINLQDVPHLRLKGGHVFGASPNSAFQSGHNGVLLHSALGQDDIHVWAVRVEDAGEHGFRISGPKQQCNVWLHECSTHNVGGTGFKLRGSTPELGVFNDGVYFDNCVAEDSGYLNANTCGFMIEMARNVHLINPVVRKRDKPDAAYYGISIGGVHDVQITNPSIADMGIYGLHIEGRDGDVSNVTVNGLHVDSPLGFGVYLKNDNATFTNISISGRINPSATVNAGVYAGGTGAWAGLNTLDLTIGDGLLSVHEGTDSAAFLAEIVGPKDSTATFRDGSTWADTATGQRLVQKSGAWVAL